MQVQVQVQLQCCFSFHADLAWVEAFKGQCTKVVCARSLNLRAPKYETA